MSAEEKTPHDADAAAAKLDIIEKIVVDQLDQIETMSLEISDLKKSTAKPTYNQQQAKPIQQKKAEEPNPLNQYADTDSPEIVAAKKLIHAVDTDEILLVDGDNNARYNAAKLLVAKDILSRCVFELDGCKYKFTSPAFRLNGKKFTAPEAMKDSRLLRYLAEKGGIVVPYS